MTDDTEKKLEPLPVAGYTSQGADKVALVNANKNIEERLLRVLDDMKSAPEIDQRWLAIARTQFEQGFMALNRSIFRPQRIKIDEDNA